MTPEYTRADDLFKNATRTTIAQDVKNSILEKRRAMIKTETICDRCRKKITKHDTYSRAQLSFSYVEYVSSEFGYNNVDETYDLCGECLLDIRKFVFNEE